MLQNFVLRYIYNILCTGYTGIHVEASSGGGAQACVSKCDKFWVRFPHYEIKYLIFFEFLFGE